MKTNNQILCSNSTLEYLALTGLSLLIPFSPQSSGNPEEEEVEYKIKKRRRTPRKQGPLIIITKAHISSQTEVVCRSSALTLWLPA